MVACRGRVVSEKSKVNSARINTVVLMVKPLINQTEEFG